MVLTKQLNRTKRYFIAFFKWGFLGLLIGLIGGVLGAAFHHALHFVTHLRQENNWILYLLPLGGVLTVGIYSLLKLRNNRGTNAIIDAVLKDEQLDGRIAPGIFLSTMMTHLFGGSAGREGAALQLGGSTAQLLSRLLRLNTEERKVLTMAGMAAVFAGLFGTPLTATMFTMEFISVGSVFTPALLPCFLAAFSAAKISGLMNVHAEVHYFTELISLDVPTIGRLLILGIAVGLLGILLCRTLHQAEYLAATYLPNPWLRILLGALLLIAMTLVAGNHRYNGAGMDMALLAVSGQAQWYDFAVKLLFTAVTLAAGFRGGEIVPTFCIGATFGCILGGLLGLDPGFAAALCLVALFCSATNAPIASIILSVEMFGGANLQAFAFVCVIAFVISGNWSLYASQLIEFSKSRLVRRNQTEF